MGTEIDTATTMNTYINGTAGILKDSIYGAGGNTVTAVNAEFFLYNDSASLALGKSTCRAGFGARGWITSQAVAGLKTCGHSS